MDKPDVGRFGQSVPVRAFRAEREPFRFAHRLARVTSSGPRPGLVTLGNPAARFSLSWRFRPVPTIRPQPLMWHARRRGLAPQADEAEGPGLVDLDLLVVIGGGRVPVLGFFVVRVIVETSARRE